MVRPSARVNILKKLRRMASSGMLRRVALVRTNVSEELSASVIRVTRIGELRTTSAVDAILYSHSSENLNSYILKKLFEKE
jgi:hypothetical protein